MHRFAIMRITARHPRLAWAALLAVIALIALFMRDVGIERSQTMPHTVWFGLVIAAITVLVYALVVPSDTVLPSEKHRPRNRLL
jgi:hypothetical protein